MMFMVFFFHAVVTSFQLVSACGLARQDDDTHFFREVDDNSCNSNEVGTSGEVILCACCRSAVVLLRFELTGPIHSTSSR
jgi:hypothetical protein